MWKNVKPLFGLFEFLSGQDILNFVDAISLNPNRFWTVKPLEI